MAETQSFGQWLRRWRRELDLTQVQLSQAVSCSHVTIRKIEADELRPSRQLSELLVDKLGIPSEKREAHIIGIAGVASITHQYKRATTLLGFVEEQLVGLSKELLGIHKREFIRCKDQVQGALSESEFQSFLLQGQAMTMEQVISLAQEDWKI